MSQPRPLIQRIKAFLGFPSLLDTLFFTFMVLGFFLTFPSNLSMIFVVLGLIELARWLRRNRD